MPTDRSLMVHEGGRFNSTMVTIPSDYTSARQLPIVYNIVPTMWLILIVEFQNLFIIPAIVYLDTVDPCTLYLSCHHGIF